MNWPSSQDYNEAIQNPSSFAEPALKSGAVVVNAIGLPVPRSGNFADVYQFTDGDGRMWALKCFTRKVDGLQDRYAKIDEHLAKANFPFTVGFNYLAKGIRVRGQWFPLLKMEWVEGFTLNEFVRENAGKAQYLHALMQMWAKLCARLRDGNFAHADLQHGNVLLVPATAGRKLGLRLIDYDGMWVPALAEKHSGEIGHPNFQHPLRLKDRLYNADVDRFGHLVIACALRATLIGGRDLWDRFDNGDNLLFKEADLRDPASAPVFKELWGLKDDVLCTLLGKLALASKEPLRKTPWLDDLLLTPDALRLGAEEETKVIEMLGVPLHFTASKETAAVHAPAQDVFNHFDFSDDESEERPAVRSSPGPKSGKPAKGREPSKGRASALDAQAKSKQWLFIGGGIVAALTLVGGIIAVTGGGKKDDPNRSEVAKVDPAEPKAKVGAPQRAGPGLPKKDAAATGAKNDPALPKEPGPRKEAPPPKKPEEKAAPDVVKKGPLDEPRVEAAPPPSDPSAAPRRLWQTNDPVRPDSLAFANDSTQVYRAAANRPILIFAHAVADGQPAPEQITFPNGVKNMRFGFDKLYSISGGDKLFLMNFETRQVQARITHADKDCPGPVAAAIKAVLVDEPGGDVGLYAATDGKKLQSFKLPQPGHIKSMDCTPDAKAIVVLTQDGDVYAGSVDADALKPAYKFAVSGKPRIALCPNGKLIAVGPGDESIVLVDIATGKIQRTLSGHTSDVRDFAFTRDSRRLLSIAGDKSFRVWDVDSGALLHNLALGSKGRTLAVSPDGRFVAIGTEKPSCQLWELKAAGDTVVTKTDPPADAGMTELKKGPAADDVKIEKTGAEGVIATSAGLSGALTACLFSSDNKMIYAAAENGAVHVLDAVTLEEVAKHQAIDAKIVRLLVVPKAPGKDWLFIMDDQKRVHVFDLEKGAVTKKLPVDALLNDTNTVPTYRLCLAPDAHTLVISSSSGFRGAIWDIKSNTESFLTPLKGNPINSQPYLMAFSADGHFGAAYAAAQILVWDAKTGQTLWNIPCPSAVQLAIVPGANALVANTVNQSMAWSLTTGKELWKGECFALGAEPIPKSKRFAYHTALELGIRDAVKGEKLVAWKTAENLYQIAVSGDGSHLATFAMGGKKVSLWAVPPVKKP
jgi:WD40 repeat protein